MTRLTDGLRGNVAELGRVLQAGEMADAREAEQFSRAQHAGSLGPASMLARRVDLSGASRLLDVAGGSGAFTITLCAHFPELRATIVDFPNVVTVARRFVAEAGIEDRVDFVSGNALDVDWPNADVVLMSYLLSSVRECDIPVLLKRARDALTPGGCSASTISCSTTTDRDPRSQPSGSSNTLRSPPTRSRSQTPT